MILLTKDLGPLKTAAKARIDAEAENVRLRYITPGDGQAMEYQETEKEALMVCEDPGISPAEVPLIAAEAALYDEPLLDTAARILTIKHQWKMIAAVIKGARLAAKTAVDAANTPAAIEAATAVDWDGLIASIEGYEQ